MSDSRISPRQHLSNLRDAAPTVLPSLLLCDFGNLEREVQRLEQAGVRALHLDVMDGVFVPNLTYGMPIVAALRRLTDLALDVHLMIAKPEQYIDQFLDAGADIVTVHIEAVENARSALTQIRDRDAGAGITLNPQTPLSTIEDCLDLCDLVLVMSVDAGFGGQEFNPVALDKLRRLRELTGDDVLLEVDGGVNADTVKACAEAGAQLFVVGSALFRNDNYATTVKKLTELATVA